MLKNIHKIALTAIIAAGLFGCTQQAAIQKESQLDQNWGRSFESARYNQTLNPEAGKNTEPVDGLQGPAAERIMDGYISGDTSKQEPSSEFGVVTIKR